MLTAILDDSATNAFGVAYGRLGFPRQCAQEMAVRLGPKAKPLERLLTTDASNGHTTAVRALAALGSLEVASVKALVENMTSADFELAEESALALVKTGHAGVAKEVATTRRLQGLIAKWSLSLAGMPASGRSDWQLWADSVEKLEWRLPWHICRGGQTIPRAAIVDPGSI